MNRFFITDRQLILGVIATIASHPLLETCKIYYPIVQEGEEPERITVQKWRAYQGIELLEPGLAVSIYHQWYNRSTSVEVIPYTLGSPSTSEYLDKLTHKVVIELKYQDASFGEEFNLKFDQSNTNEANGRRVKITDQSWLQLPLTEHFKGVPVERKELIVEIMPGEEIIKEFVTLFRAIVKDIPTLLGNMVRQASIRSIEYESINWEKNQGRNLIFHTAKIYLLLDVWEPPIAPQHRFLPPIKALTYSTP